MKIRQRKQEATEMEGEPIKEVLDNKLELIKFTSQVQSRIKNDITEDYTLAVLEEKDKEFIMEMTKNAYFAKKNHNETHTQERMDKERRFKQAEIEKYVNKFLGNRECPNDCYECLFEATQRCVDDLKKNKKIIEFVKVVK